MKEIDFILRDIKKKRITKNFSLHPPILDTDDQKFLKEIVKSNWISTKGKKTIEFVKNLQDYFNVNYSVAINSGTSALFLALKALNVRPGDEVIVSNISFIAVPNAIIYSGATPYIHLLTKFLKLKIKNLF